MSENLVKKLLNMPMEIPKKMKWISVFIWLNLPTSSPATESHLLNDTYKGSDFRLMPPAIFAGDNLDVSTPKVLSSSFVYHT